MRDPNRLDDFYAEKCRLHKEHYPDMRVGQFDSNFYGWLAGVKRVDLFFPEENKMIEYLKEFVGEK